MKLNRRTQLYLKNKTKGYLSNDQSRDKLKHYLRLDLGENLLDHAKISTEKKYLGENTLRYYSDPSNSGIKKTISSLYNLSPKNITIANNSNEIIDFLPKMINEENSRNIVVLPTFFRIIDSLNQVNSKNLYLSLREDNGFIPDNNLINNIIKTGNKNHVDTIWICNPNNPTGEIYSLRSIEKILKSTEAILIVDEAFFEFYDYKNENSAIRLVNKYKNLIVLRTLSKAYGLAGIRLGYALSNPEIIEKIENYRDTLLMTSNIVVKLGEAALKDQSFIKQTAIETKKLRTDLFNEIKGLKNLKIGSLSKTNIFILKHLKKDIYKELLNKNILTADFRSAKGLERLGYVRITVGDKNKNKALIRVLKDIN